ncbi:Shedu anti-phage system protein SduA domain-containing protein [Xanthomonas axonopodis]
MAAKNKASKSTSKSRGSAARVSKVKIPGGIFHQVDVATIKKIWSVDVDSLEVLLNKGVVSGAGVGEKTLLDWVGHSVERVALLAFATHGFFPHYVAREFSMAGFRADFAWIVRADHGVNTSTVCFVELENALPETLFRPGSRAQPYFGTKFLDGFSQLVDWCSFGKTEAESNAPIAAVLAGSASSSVSYQYCLIAGVDDFLNAHTKARLNWWRDNIKLGHGTQFHTYSEIMGLIKFRIGNLGPVF